jgi:hypothetical protein
MHAIPKALWGLRQRNSSFRVVLKCTSCKREGLCVAQTSCRSSTMHAILAINPAQPAAAAVGAVMLLS